MGAFGQIMLRVVFRGGAILVALVAGSVFAGSQEEPIFKVPISEDPPRVWEWKIVQEEVLDPERMFVYRYHRAAEGEKAFGPYALTVALRHFPEFGALYIAWGIKMDDDGKYDFSSAVFAFQKEWGWWYMVPASFTPKAVAISKRDVTVVYDHEKTLVYRRLVPPEFGGREKFVVTIERRIWAKERHTYIKAEGVIIKIGKPGDPEKDPPGTLREVWVAHLKFSQPKVIEKIEKLER